MSVDPYTKFKSVTDFNETLLTENIEDNLKHYLRWSLLNIGCWQDVNIPQSGIDGGDFSLLTPVIDNSYDDYRVYETPKLDIVYESGIDFNGLSPIEISGVWINDDLYGPDFDISHPYFIDYENGRIIFDDPLADTDVVKLNYSYRTISVQMVEESPMWKQIQYGSLRVEDPHVLDRDKGDWAAIPSIRRQQLPAIFIEAIPVGSNKPWELGAGGHLVYRDILLHVVAENRRLRNRIMDILASEEEHTLWIWDSNNISIADWPLDYRGMKNSGGLMYPELINKYKWLRTFILKTYISDIESRNPNLHEATVRIKTETIFGKK